MDWNLVVAGIKTLRHITKVVRGGPVAVFLAVALCSAVPAGSAEHDVLQLSDYRGKIVVLDFWASWCVPCRRSFPWMNDMQHKYGDKGLVVIAVNLDNEPDDAAKFLQEYPADFTIAYDRGGKFARQYSVEAMPSSFVIDRGGQIIERDLGFKSGRTEEYEAVIVAALQMNQEFGED